MNLEKGKISSSEFTFLIAGIIIASVVTVVYATQITRHDNWIAVILGFGMSLPLILLYIGLAQRFPDNNFFQIHDIIYGTFLGKLISSFYVFFIFTVLISNLRFVGDFTLTYLMPETPMLVILILFLGLCAWAVRSGIEVIARMSPILVFVATSFLLFTTLLVSKDMDLTNFLPILDIPIIKLFQGAHIIVSIPFCEIIIFLLFTPTLNQKHQLKRSVVIGVCFGALYLMISVFRNIAALGPIIDIMSAPSYEAVRLIKIAGFLTRLEILFAVTLMIVLFVKVSILFYVTVLGTAQLFNLRSYLPLVTPLGIIAIIFSIVSFESNIEQSYIGSNIWPFWTLPFEVILPALSLLLVKIRKLPKKRGAKRK